LPQLSIERNKNFAEKHNPRMNHYSEMVKALVKPGEDIIKQLTPKQAHLWHMATLLAGEAGELLDAVKKHVVYGKPLDMENVIEEMGDIEFGMEAMRQIIGMDRESILIANKAKLSKRYFSGKYTNEQAIERADKVEEVAS
jgi:NTP pyrophosphatase (non-canonical NTP hydrolase)